MLLPLLWSSRGPGGRLLVQWRLVLILRLPVVGLLSDHLLLPDHLCSRGLSRGLWASGTTIQVREWNRRWY